MSSDNEIRKSFQSKFSDYQAKLPDDGWARLEMSLNAIDRARIILRRWWYAGAAAAVLILLVGSILFLRMPDETNRSAFTEWSMETEQQPESCSSADKAIDPQSEAPTEAPVPPSLIGSRHLPPRSVVAGKATGKGKGKSHPRERVSPVMKEWMRRGFFVAAEESGDSDRGKKMGQLLSDLSPNQRKTLPRNKVTDEEVFIVSTDQTLYAMNESSPENKGGWSLALGSKGGLNSYQQTVNSPMTLRSASVASDEHNAPLNNKIMYATANSVASHVSEMEHAQPLSFGISLSKSLSDHLSVETGLVYTYLFSRVRNVSPDSQLDENQRLYYFGVPLNLNYRLFSFQKLNIYASLGGLIEKDLYGEYRTYGNEQKATLNGSSMEIQKISLSHPQFSLNAGLGISFPLYHRFSLYGKMGGSYYFDAKNVGYSTIYSDRKIVLDLNLGIKYDF